MTTAAECNLWIAQRLAALKYDLEAGLTSSVDRDTAIQHSKEAFLRATSSAPPLPSSAFTPQELASFMQNTRKPFPPAPELLTKPPPAPLPALVHVTTDAAGHMHTVPAPAPTTPDLPRLRAELRAMLRGDIAFHTDPYTAPKE